MRKHHFIKSVIILLSLALSVAACEDMNSIQEEYSSRDEIVYLSKVDSVTAYPGVRQVKLVYWISADPKIEQTVVYWNVRQDSLVKDFVREVPGKQKDSIIVTGLEPGTYQFQFRNKNSRGEYSLYSSAVGRALSEAEAGIE